MGEVRNLIIPFFGSGGEVWGWLGDRALKAPYPYDGGKSKASEVLMGGLGLEPGALPPVVTVNDQNCYVANFWRAVTADPEAVAQHADWPVNEADMHARHRWLLGIAPDWPAPEYPEAPKSLAEDQRAAWSAGWYACYRGEHASWKAAFQHRIRRDPDYFDVRFAGWWCWGMCMWIGSGWCNDTHEGGTKAPFDRNAGCRPHLGDGGYTHGVHDKRPSLGDGNRGSGEKGVLSKRPVLSPGNTSHGQGVLRQPCDLSGNERPRIAEAYGRGVGVHGGMNEEACAERRAWLCEWFGRLRDVTRTWRVCCGDFADPMVWRRVCGVAVGDDADRGDGGGDGPALWGDGGRGQERDRPGPDVDVRGGRGR